MPLVVYIGDEKDAEKLATELGRGECQVGYFSTNLEKMDWLLSFEPPGIMICELDAVEKAFQNDSEIAGYIQDVSQTDVPIVLLVNEGDFSNTTPRFTGTSNARINLCIKGDGDTTRLVNHVHAVLGQKCQTH